MDMTDSSCRASALRPSGQRLPGDFNRDGSVDAADYVVWRKNPGGIYTPDDYNVCGDPLRPKRRQRLGSRCQFD